MEFTVPQFIEKEAKIVGPFTFKQFLFIGAGGGVIVVLYFVLPFLFFIIGAIIIVIAAFLLSFVRIEKIGLPTYIANLFTFFFKPKIYLWDKKTGAPKYLKQEKKTVKDLIEKKEEKQPTLKASRGSRLDELFTKLETK